MRVIEDLVQIFVALRLRQAGVLQEHGIALDGGQRRLELVRDTGDEVIRDAVDPVHFAHECVEVPQGRLHLFKLTRVFDRDAVVAARDLARGLAQLDHRGQHAPPDEKAGAAACGGRHEQQGHERGDVDVADDAELLQGRQRADNGAERDDDDDGDDEQVIRPQTQGKAFILLHASAPPYNRCPERL